MKRCCQLMTGILLLTALAACLPQTPATSTPQLNETEQIAEEPVTETATPDASAPLPEAPPTSVALTAWPLAADLFYLTDTGQVWRQPLLGDARAAVAVTSTEVAVQDFAVAPGGNWLLIRTADSISITSLDGSQGRVIAQTAETTLPALSQPAPDGGHTLAWAPDAGKLAYITESGFQVLIPGTGDYDEARLYPVSEEPLASLSWSPDSNWLLITRMDGSSALYSLSPLRKWVETGQMNGHTWLNDGRLAFAPVEGGLALLVPGDVQSRVFLVPQDRQITHPIQRPDGTLAFFTHSANISEPGFLNLADPEALSFHVESNVAIQTGSLMWDPAGERLIQPGSEPETLTLIDPISGSSMTIDSSGSVARLAWSDLPPRGVAGLAMPADLYFLAPQAGTTQVWRLPANGEPPRAITSANSDILAYHVSPDGTQITYASAGFLWRMVINTLDVTQIATLDAGAALPSDALAFSPNGREIAYADGGIWVYNLDTQESRLLIANQTGGGSQPRQYEQPRWSIDGSWLLIRVEFAEGYDHALIAAAGGEPVLLNLFGSQAEWLFGGTAAAYSTGNVYGRPFVGLVQAGQTPSYAQLQDIPVVGVQMREDGRIALLRVPIPGAGGPTIVQAYSVLSNGTDLRSDSLSFVLEQAQFSPTATLIAGLSQTHVDDQGMLTGRLAIANTETGDLFSIQSVTEAHALQWGQ